MQCFLSECACCLFARSKRVPRTRGNCSMRYAPLLSLVLLSLSSCVVPAPTSTTYVTPATTTTYTTPATSTTVFNAPPGYHTGYAVPQSTTTVIRTP